MVNAQLVRDFIFATQIVHTKSEISSPLPFSVAIHPGLCRTWSETPKTGFFMTLLKSYVCSIGNLVITHPMFLCFSLNELVKHEENGLVFQDSKELSQQIQVQFCRARLPAYNDLSLVG